MKATLVARTRVVYAENAFAEMVLWKLPAPSKGSSHGFKYRLAYVVDGVCVIRYDNETGKGGHRHAGADETELPYRFASLEKLVADFRRECAQLGWRWEE